MVKVIAKGEGRDGKYSVILLRFTIKPVRSWVIFSWVYNKCF